MSGFSLDRRQNKGLNLFLAPSERACFSDVYATTVLAMSLGPFAILVQNSNVSPEHAGVVAARPNMENAIFCRILKTFELLWQRSKALRRPC